MVTNQKQRQPKDCEWESETTSDKALSQRIHFTLAITKSRLNIVFVVDAFFS